MTNVKLSKQEIRLVTDAELILTKNRIIQKVYELFGELSEVYSNTGNDFPGEVTSIPPKISKGENYLGLPWVMLDHPRKFSQTDVFAVRSFFWWGKFFSITLHLHGIYQKKYATAVNNHFKGAPGEWHYCINSNDPWQHHFEEENFKTISAEVDLKDLPFIKLSKKIPLGEWDNSFQFFSDAYKEISDLLSS